MLRFDQAMLGLHNVTCNGKICDVTSGQEITKDGCLVKDNFLKKFVVVVAVIGHVTRVLTGVPKKVTINVH
jgi:hypothetical protein